MKIKKERGYSYTDVCTVHPDHLPNFETKIKSFFEGIYFVLTQNLPPCKSIHTQTAQSTLCIFLCVEHIHTDEEIRYCLEGSGYFDVRDKQDKWIRIHLEAGDMIVLPEGIYHRFTCDSGNYIKAMRLFVGEPVWTPYNRKDIDENNPSRIKYNQLITA